MKNKIKTGIFVLSGMMALSLVGVLASTKTNQYSASAEAPSKTYATGDAATYYNSIGSTLSGTDLLAALRTLNLNKRQTHISYSAMGTSPSGMFKYTDYDPATVQYDSNGQPYGTQILSFYSGKSVTSWNREHVWPNSHGGGSDSGIGGEYPDQDIFMPRPTIQEENSNRGNSFYVENMVHSSNGWDPWTAFGASMGCYNDEGIRGECARIIFYCMTVNEKLNLETNNVPTTFDSKKTMGNLADLLKWNLLYGVNQRELNRQEGGEYLQGNRNAFVDHPEYACKIWGNYDSKTKSVCSMYGEAPTQINLSMTSTTIAEGSTGKITVTVDKGSDIVTWASSNSSVAKVDANGVVTGLSAGTATITATSSVDENVKQTIQVTIKGLSGISASGTPTTTTYSADKDFDPTGLTITVTYTDGSTANITSSVTWDALVEGNTSVTGHYGSKTVTISGLTITAAEYTYYVKYTGALSEGDYVIADGTNAMSNYINSSRWKNETITVSDNKVTDPDDSIVWHIAQSGSYWTIQSKDDGKYAASSGSKNSGAMSDSATDDMSLWENSGTSTYEFVSKYNKAAGINSNIRYNNGYGFGTYATGTGSSLTLYKKSNTTPTPTKTLTSITVSGQTTSFTVGDTFSFGGIVTAHYSDNSSETVSGATFTGYDMTTAGTQTVTVTYQGKTATYSITVKSGTTPTPVGGTATYTVTGKTAVSSNGAPTGSSATFSQTYTGNAGQITSGTTTTLVLSGYAGTKITKITLNMKSNTSKGGGSFSAVAGSTTISSISNSKFNTSNWNGAWSTSYVDVIPSMSNASYAIQNNENVTLTITASESSLYISSYTIEYESASSPTPAKTLTSITVDNPTTAYTVGDSFIKPTVTAHYSDNSTEDVSSNATFSGYDMSTAGTQTVTATYEGKTATYSITVSAPIITLESITIDGQTTTFTVGDAFAFGGTVTAHYSDGSSANVTSAATFTGYDMTTAGTQTVTVTYEGKTTSYSITVKSGTTPTPAGGYTITFDTVDEDSTAVASANDLIAFIREGASNVGSISPITKAYKGVNGVKLGSGSATGSITINLSNEGKVTCTDIKVGIVQYGSDTGKIVVSTNFATTGVQLTPADTLTEFTTGLAGNLTSITISTTSKRAYISYIKVVTGGTTPDKTLESISISGQTTSFTVGDAFSFGGTVTAHYSDDSTDDVTANTTFSGYDMSSASTQTVTATYEGKTTTYSIIVKSGTTPTQTVTDEITVADLAATGSSYAAFSDVAKESDARYAGLSSKNSSNMQFKSKDSTSGIVSTVSGGKIKSIEITVGTGSNQIDVYGSNTAYSGAGDLYNTSKQGTLLGSVRETGTITVTGDYQYVGLRSNNGAIYVASIKFVWAASGSSEDTPEELAEAWATEFLNVFTCDVAGISAPSKSAWAEQAASYNALDADVKALFVAATYTISGSGSATVVTASDGVNQKVAEAVARYDYVIRKYSVNDYENFMSRSVSSSNLLAKNHNSAQDATILLIGLASFTAIAVGCVRFHKKQKEN